MQDVVVFAIRVSAVEPSPGVEEESGEIVCMCPTTSSSCGRMCVCVSVPCVPATEGEHTLTTPTHIRVWRVIQLAFIFVWHVACQITFSHALTPSMLDSELCWWIIYIYISTAYIMSLMVVSWIIITRRWKQPTGLGFDVDLIICLCFLCATLSLITKYNRSGNWMLRSCDARLCCFIHVEIIYQQCGAFDEACIAIQHRVCAVAWHKPYYPNENVSLFHSHVGFSFLHPTLLS
jgi:hypothetical protein